MTAIESPEKQRLPVPHVEFEACLHISETLFGLTWYAAPDAGPSYVFVATGPEGPLEWKEHVAIAWDHPDTLTLTYDNTVEVQSAVPDVDGLHIVYRKLPHAGL